MRRPLAALVIASVLAPALVLAQEVPVTRRDGFLLIWESIERPAYPAKTAFIDLPETERGSLEIDYAVQRGILDDGETFRPNDPLIVQDALIWLFRTRNVAYPLDVNAETLGTWMNTYPITSASWSEQITAAELQSVIDTFDKLLKDEVHEVSLYAENFHGDGTAFGETFDMHAYTAAHRTFPHNTLVRVTNVEDGKSVVVRINDRGPFVHGRDMDLSLASFTHIALRAKGKINTRFERLGDVDILRSRRGTPNDALTADEWTLVDGSGATVNNAVQPATEEEEEEVVERAPTCVASLRSAKRFIKDVHFLPGVPDRVEVGYPVTFGAQRAFVVRGATLPDGSYKRIEDWVLSGEDFTFTPGIKGLHTLHLQLATGEVREVYTRAEICK